ncbi:hypothetical protein HMI54_008787 [Coelomomyces lativittatus]|nr:hypothetical protein HMI54_008787 [Coelomomyces lativittatus]KAJ1508167.1 hypothetical protein HMI55_000480 [Coelomomyces lativittatus]KAJ1508215.1 hypothetical protein HMI56_007401 [Coelomomyces lativittatus]
MFTGIVETIGTILHITKPPYDDSIPTSKCSETTTLSPPTPVQGSSLSSSSSSSSSSSGETSQSGPWGQLPVPSEGWTLVIGNCESILNDCKLGDSIAVNGTCLTVIDVTSTQFKVHVSRETLSRTHFSDLQVDDYVNLERAMQCTDRWHGHYVQGHVDTTVELHVDDLDPFMDPGTDGSSGGSQGVGVVTFTLPLENKAWIVQKGYVCIDGTSLTVCDLTDTTFSVHLIPYTFTHTNLGWKLQHSLNQKKKDTVHVNTIQTPSCPEKNEPCLTSREQPPSRRLLKFNFEADIFIKSFHRVLEVQGMPHQPPLFSFSSPWFDLLVKEYEKQKLQLTKKEHEM